MILRYSKNLKTAEECPYIDKSMYLILIELMIYGLKMNFSAQAGCILNDPRLINVEEKVLY
jgi:hypothetical protein